MPQLQDISLFSDANLVAYYKLEDTSDSKGSFTLTNNGSVTFSAAKFGNGANFGNPNTTKYLSNTGNLGIDGGAITICGWLKQTAEITTGTNILFQQGSATSKVSYSINYEFNAGTPRLNINRTKSGIANDTVFYTISLGTTVYHQIAITYDTATVTAYVDGVSQGTVASSGSGSTAVTSGFFIGQNTAGSNSTYEPGIFDDVAVFSRALTAAEITKIYQTSIQLNNYQFVKVGNGMSASEKIR